MTLPEPVEGRPTRTSGGNHERVRPRAGRPAHRRHDAAPQAARTLRTGGGPELRLDEPADRGDGRRPRTRREPHARGRGARGRGAPPPALAPAPAPAQGRRGAQLSDPWSASPLVVSERPATVSR